MYHYMLKSLWQVRIKHISAEQGKVPPFITEKTEVQTQASCKIRASQIDTDSIRGGISVLLMLVDESQPYKPVKYS